MCSGGGSPKAPPPAAPPPEPAKNIDTAQRKARSDTAKRAAANFGQQGTVATGGMGLVGPAYTTGQKTMLGQ